MWGLVVGGFFIHFYDHIDKVSSVPSLLGNTATLSWIEWCSWEVRYSYYNSLASVVLCAFVNKQPCVFWEQRLKDCFSRTINCDTEIIRRSLIGLLCYSHVGDITISVPVKICDDSNGDEKWRWGVWLYIFNDPVHVGLHQTVGVLIFPVFKQRMEEMETRRICSQSTNHQNPPYSLPPSTSIFRLHSISSPHLLPCPFSSITLSSPSSPPYFCHSSSSFSLHYCPSLSPLYTGSPASSTLSSLFCPLQRPSLARQGWLQICSTVPWG